MTLEVFPKRRDDHRGPDGGRVQEPLAHGHPHGEEQVGRGDERYDRVLNPQKYPALASTC